MGGGQLLFGFEPVWIVEGDGGKVGEWRECVTFLFSYLSFKLFPLKYALRVGVGGSEELRIVSDGDV